MTAERAGSVDSDDTTLWAHGSGPGRRFEACRLRRFGRYHGRGARPRPGAAGGGGGSGKGGEPHCIRVFTLRRRTAMVQIADRVRIDTSSSMESMIFQQGFPQLLWKDEQAGPPHPGRQGSRMRKRAPATAHGSGRAGKSSRMRYLHGILRGEYEGGGRYARCARSRRRSAGHAARHPSRHQAQTAALRTAPAATSYRYRVVSRRSPAGSRACRLRGTTTLAEAPAGFSNVPGRRNAPVQELAP